MLNKLQKCFVFFGFMMSGVCAVAMQDGAPKSDSRVLALKQLIREVTCLCEHAVLEEEIEPELCDKIREVLMPSKENKATVGTDENKSLIVHRCENLPEVKSILKKTGGKNKKHKNKHKHVTFGTNQIHYLTPHKEPQI